jgi:hypothetical protein
VIENQQMQIAVAPKLIESLFQKVSKYEHYMNTTIYDLVAQSQDVSVFEKPAYIQVDFIKIKNYFLQNAQNFVFICAVLQALRWRITKTKGAYIRREIVVSYAYYDVVGCKP